MTAPDKFFEVLLVDGAIMYNVYNPVTGILDITYKDVSYLCDLSEFSSSFPERRRYTLQTCGLYLFACQSLQLDGELSYDTVAGNYLILKQRNTSQKSDLTSLLLISVPSFLLPILSHATTPSTKLTGAATGWNHPQEVSPKNGSSDSSYSIILAILAIIIIIMLMVVIYQKKH